MQYKVRTGAGDDDDKNDDDDDDDVHGSLTRILSCIMIHKCGTCRQEQLLGFVRKAYEDPFLVSRHRGGVQGQQTDVNNA